MLSGARFRGRLLGIYRSYRKGVECVYAEWGKEALQLTGQPKLLHKWQLRLGFRAAKSS